MFSSVLPVDPERHQIGSGASGDVHRLCGGHSRGEVCAILRSVHALTQTHRRERRAEGAPAASWQDHRVHQPHRPGCRQGEGTSAQEVIGLSTDTLNVLECKANRTSLHWSFCCLFYYQFMPDASAVMQLLLKTQTDFNDLEDDDPQVKHMKLFKYSVFLIFTHAA